MSASRPVGRATRWLLMAGHVPGSAVGGGIVRYTVELARALERRDDVELHLQVSSGAAGGLAELVGGDRSRLVVLPRVPEAATPAVERGLLTPLLRSRFDVVQGVKHLLPVGLRCRTALTVHDMLLLDRPHDFGSAKRLLLRRPYLGSLRQASSLVCVSAATRDRLAAWSPRDGARAAVVPLATSPRLHTAEPVPVPQVAGSPFALVVGDPSPRKNLPTVVSAWARVAQERPDARLVLVGPPAWGAASYGPEHQQLVDSGRLVQLTGVDDGTLRWCYQHADVVLAPSLAEGFGLPAAEALDLGAPLVTSTDAALREVSAGRAEHLEPDDVPAWSDAVLRHLAAGRADRAPDAARSWDDVASATVSAVLGRP